MQSVNLYESKWVTKKVEPTSGQTIELCYKRSRKLSLQQDKDRIVLSES